MKRILSLVLLALAFSVNGADTSYNQPGINTAIPIKAVDNGDSTFSYGVSVRSAVTGTGTSSQTVQGTAAAGATPVGNPVLEGGTDGTNVRAMLLDTSGRQMAVGAAATGAAVTGNPVLVGGSDGANAQAMKTDTGGRVMTVGGAANGATVVGNPLLLAGADSGAVTRTLRTDTAGIQLVSPSLAGVAVHAFSGNVANTTATASLSATASVVNYLTGFLVAASGSTAALVVDATITGLAGGTMTFPVVFPAGATVAATPIAMTFPVPLQASAANTAIVITVPAGGAGNAHTSVSLFGFRF